MLGKKWKPDYEKTQSLPAATPDVLVPKVDDPPPAVTEADAPSKCGSKEGGEEPSATANANAKKKRKRKAKNAHQISTKGKCFYNLCAKEDKVINKVEQYLPM
jgi:hypothetical protein